MQFIMYGNSKYNSNLFFIKWSKLSNSSTSDSWRVTLTGSQLSWQIKIRLKVVIWSSLDQETSQSSFGSCSSQENQKRLANQERCWRDTLISWVIWHCLTRIRCCWAHLGTENWGIGTWPPETVYRDSPVTPRNSSLWLSVQITDIFVLEVPRRRSNCTTSAESWDTAKTSTSTMIGFPKLDSPHSSSPSIPTLCQSDGTDGSRSGTRTGPSDTNSRRTSPKSMPWPSTPMVSWLPLEERTRKCISGTSLT